MLLRESAHARGVKPTRSNFAHFFDDRVAELARGRAAHGQILAAHVSHARQGGETASRRPLVDWLLTEAERTRALVAGLDAT